MRGRTLLGAIAGGLACVGLGYGVAVLPATPTWALWQIKVALDQRDGGRLRELVDLPAVAAHALNDLSDAGAGDRDGEPRRGPSLGDIAGTLLSGGKLLTVFNDPEQPLRLGAADFARAWWRMGRREGEATVPLEVGDREVTLLLGQRPDGAWRVVGITPLRALLRVKPKPEHTTRRAPPAGVARAAAPGAARLTARSADG